MPRCADLDRAATPDVEGRSFCWIFAMPRGAEGTSKQQSRHVLDPRNRVDGHGRREQQELAGSLAFVMPDAQRGTPRSCAPRAWRRFPRSLRSSSGKFRVARLRSLSGSEGRLRLALIGSR